MKLIVDLSSTLAVDIVTETDKGVEKMVSERLSTSFPGVAFMGEETYKPGMKLGSEPTFIVDPIDGEGNSPLYSLGYSLYVSHPPALR